MQYTYNIVDAAALWADVRPSEIRRRMELADNEKAEIEYLNSLERARQRDLDDRAIWLEKLNVCDFQCALESVCPEWREIETEDGDRRLVLKCPNGFNQKPADNPPTSRIVTRQSVKIRLVPFPGEFEDLPGFEQRLGWLQAALNMGDIDGTPEVVRARDLRLWMEENFPSQRPEFLFPREYSFPQNKIEINSEKIEHQPDQVAGRQPVSRTMKLKNKKPNLLAPIIERLVREKESADASIIFPALREMALKETPPLNGVEGKYILWTDSNGVLNKLTRDALVERLRRLGND